MSISCKQGWNDDHDAKVSLSVVRGNGNGIAAFVALQTETVCCCCSCNEGFAGNISRLNLEGKGMACMMQEPPLSVVESRLWAEEGVLFKEDFMCTVEHWGCGDGVPLGLPLAAAGE